VKGSSAGLALCNVTGDYNHDQLVTYNYNSLLQLLYLVTSNIVTHDVTHDCDLWDGDHHVISLLGHSAFIESNARVLALSILYIAHFIQKHPIGSHPIKQFSPILGMGSIM